MRWRKVGVVASTEFQNAVRTKAFLISVLMLPVIYGAAILIQVFAQKADTTPRPFAVLDHTGVLYPAIADRARAHNQTAATRNGRPAGPRFEPEPIAVDQPDLETVRLELSRRIRQGELFAYIEIPAAVIDPQAAGSTTIRYHSNSPTDQDLYDWLGRVLSDEIRARRLERAGMDPGLVSRLTLPAPMENLGLVTAPAPASTPAAGPKAAGPPPTTAAALVDPVRAFGLPVALLFAMFMVIMTTTPQLMQTVLEEKMSKISEVLLGSVTPFELMMGKLAGNAGVALLLAALYLGGAYGVAFHYGYGDIAPAYLIVTTAFFIVVGVLLFGSLFMAVGSACNDLKEAQSLMFPVMILAILPMLLWSVVLTKPSSTLAVGASLFPPATPFLMLMRMALSPAPPVWQVGLSVVLTSLTTLGCIWAAGKIIRTGLLMQGKAPSFAELARWALAR